MTGEYGDGFESFLPQTIDRRQALRWLSASSVAVSSGMFLAGCGSSSSTTSKGGSSPLKATFAPATKHGGTLTLGVTSGQEESPDPLFAGGEVAQYNGVLCFDRLATLDRNKPGWVLVPRLAESWSISPDAMTYTIRIRRGVVFHNGQSLTANDVAFNLRRYLQSGSVLQGDLSPYYKPSGVSVLDSHTVQVKLIKPSALLMYVWREKEAAIYPANTTDFKTCIGTGPFKLVNYNGTQGCEVVKNTNYWQPGKPLLDKVRVTVLPEVASITQALVAGQIDAIAPNDLPYTNIEQVAKASGIVVLPLKNYFFENIQANPYHKPFNDVRVREALALSVNPTQVSDQLFQGNAVNAANIPVAPSDPFFPQSLKSFKPNIAKAKALLSQAGYAHGLSFPLVISNDPRYVNSMLLFANQFKTVGLNPVITEKPNSLYYYQNSGWGTGVAWQDGWWLKHPVIMALYLLQSTPSYLEWTPSWISAAIERAMSLTDQAEQIRAITPVFEAASTQAGLVIPVIHDGFVPMRANLRGLDQNTFNLDGYFEQVGFA